jgi:hypothetical protein
LPSIPWTVAVVEAGWYTRTNNRTPDFFDDVMTRLEIFAVIPHSAAAFMFGYPVFFYCSGAKVGESLIARRVRGTNRGSRSRVSLALGPRKSVAPVCARVTGTEVR